MPGKNPEGEPPNSRSARRVTVRDIAKRLGVSHTTVSLSLRNNPQISPAMREKVRQAADEMGYQSDPMLSALAQYRLSNQDKPVQSALAWINPLKNPEVLRRQREFNLYWTGACAAARQLGFSLEEFRTADTPLQRMESIFKTRNIRGILIAGMLPAALHDDTIDWYNFTWQDFAVVRFGRKTTHPQAHFITSAQAANTIMAFNRMTERGYRRIGFVGEYTEARVFLAGFLFAQQNIPAADRVPPLLFFREELPRPENKTALKHWIAQHRPDAILTDRDYILELLNRIGCRVPDDVGLATTSIHDTPIVAGIDQNPEEIGRTAVHLLAAEINQNHLGIPGIRSEMLIEGRWQDGPMLPDRG